MRYKKLFVIIFLGLIIFSALPIQAADDKDLDTTFPEVKFPDDQTYAPEKVTTSVPQYISYVYYFLIGLSGLLALFVFIDGGIKYLMSSGNPEAMKGAKDKIIASLIGVLILIGSWALLYGINPDLISFNLPELRPIISRLTPGVLVCKKPVEASRIRLLTLSFDTEKDVEKQRIISKEIDGLIKEVSENCVYVSTARSFYDDFEDKITNIYFIEGTSRGADGHNYAVVYGAIIYGDYGFKGSSKPFYEHFTKNLRPPDGVNEINKAKDFPNINILSIKPFIVNWQHNENANQVVLYNNYNGKSEDNYSGTAYRLLPDYYFEKVDLPSHSNTIKYITCSNVFCSPKSIQVGGEFMAVLVTPDGRSESFYNVVDNNLDDNSNITKTVSCKDYKSSVKVLQPGGSIYGTEVCAQPQIKELIIISAKAL